MVNFKIVIVAGFNLVGIPLSLVLIVTALYQFSDGYSGCDHDHPVVILLLGFLLLVLAITGVVGALRHNALLLTIYLRALFVVIAALFVYVAILFVETGKAPSGMKKPNEVFRIQEFSPMLRKNQLSDKSWRYTKGCFDKEDVCGINNNGDFDKTPKAPLKKPAGIPSGHGNLKAHVTNKASLVSSLLGGKVTGHARSFFSVIHTPPLLLIPVILDKVGCCRPPKQCGFVNVEVNETSKWVAPKSGFLSKDPDCTKWSADRNKMCFDCDTCKAAKLAEYVLEARMEMGWLRFYEDANKPAIPCLAYVARVRPYPDVEDIDQLDVVLSYHQVYWTGESIRYCTPSYLGTHINQVACTENQSEYHDANLTRRLYTAIPSGRSKIGRKADWLLAII
ncbi:hypothetical protein RJ640_007828 [Escallonia rubra]|uniref:Uncharacterized protein n=1 Tax=Escallonia rubra TaxID=112253 RepID=A0AA88R6P3_9ASTE|nr:hypothetical protein RJ640_007828 [Escallonia rubra]